MDSTFLLISFIFIIFIVLSYYLGVIRLSTPIILIYIIFCFTHILDEGEIILVNDKAYSDLDSSKVSVNNKNKEAIISKKVNNDGEIHDISKPVVSFNPRPIIIDSNLIIQKDKEKIISQTSDSLTLIANTKLKIVNDSKSTLKLNEIMICRGVYKRNPIKPGFSFTNNVDSLFCYTKISNSGNKQEIKHLWYYEDNLITSVVYNIKTSYNYRSWSKKTILSNQIGRWRVDVVDDNGKVLGSRKFKVSSLNNGF